MDALGGNPNGPKAQHKIYLQSTKGIRTDKTTKILINLLRWNGDAGQEI